MEEKRKQFYAVVIMVVLFVMQILSEGDGFFTGYLQKQEQVQAETLPKPVCSYSFNHSVGTASPVTRQGDTQEGSNAGTIPAENEAANVSYSEGISGNGIYLDGSYGLRLYPQITGNDYSVCFWVKPEKTGIFAPFLCAGDRFLTEEETSLELTGDDSDSPIVISASPKGGYFAGKGMGIAENVWNHVCMAVSGKKVLLYVDGELQSEGQILESMLSEKTEWYLGIDCYNTVFTGMFDNVEFYDSCLSEEAVSELYHQEKDSSAAETVTGISLNKTSAVLSGYGAVEPLYAELSPNNARNQEVRWTSSKEEVATVENGVVKAWKNGTAVITAETENGSGAGECI